MTRLDIAAVAAAALASAELLVQQWLPAGKRVGHEWHCGDLAGSEGDSLRINLRSGKWADFASDDKGGDLVSLFAAVQRIGQGEAARQLAADLRLDMAITATAPRASSGPRLVHAADPGDRPDKSWSDAGAWPHDGPPMPVAHYVRGAHQARWVYRDAAGGVLGAVSRYATSSGGKEILPLTWSKGPGGKREWRWRAFDEPRPLFQWDRLGRPGTRPVLVVEGEKCAEAAQAALGDAWDVTTWPGGCKAAAKANWALLARREVVIWPDCDAQLGRDGAVLSEARQPGARAAEAIAAALAQHAKSVRIVKIPAPGAAPSEGWDVADLIAGCADAPAATAAVQRMLEPCNLRAPAGARREFAAEEGWRAQLKMGGTSPLRVIFNIQLILTHDEAWRGVVGFDEFANRIIKHRAPPYAGGVAGEWTARDDTLAAIWLGEVYGCHVTSLQIAEVVEVVAGANAFHPVRAWLRGLKWDGQRRLPTWPARCLGVPESEYSRAVGTYFLRGMVRRVMEPGCKFDYCLVLEGRQGIGKSSAAAVLGGEYYSDTDLDLGHKDSMSALRGVWIHEFAEMDAIARAEAPKQKSFLSRQVDQYRPTYARREIRCPRQTVFIGSTNEDEYLRDSTGARRFWPIACSAVDLELLRREREQLFAEALHDYDAGERCYPMPEESREVFAPQQRARMVQESLIDSLHDWVYSSERYVTGDGAFSLAAAAAAVGIGAAQLTRDHQTRIGKALIALGCTKVERRNGTTRFWYQPPKKTASASGTSVLQDDEGDHIAF